MSESSRLIRSLDFSNYYIYLLNRNLFFIIFCIKIEYHKTFKMLLSLFWKNAFFPPKKAKSGQSSWKKSTFCILLKIVSLDFFHILHEVRNHMRQYWAIYKKVHFSAKNDRKWQKSAIFPTAPPTFGPFWGKKCIFPEKWQQHLKRLMVFYLNAKIIKNGWMVQNIV